MTASAISATAVQFIERLSNVALANVEERADAAETRQTATTSISANAVRPIEDPIALRAAVVLLAEVDPARPGRSPCTAPPDRW